MSNFDNVVNKLLEIIPDEFQTSVQHVRTAIKYFRKYGYITRLEDVTLGDIAKAIVVFQTLAGIKVNGMLCPKTLKAMSWPRCNCPDMVNGEAMTSKLKWGRKHFKYYIARRDSDLTSEEWADTMELAFQQWADVANVTFERVSQQAGAQFVLSTGSGRADGFDGPSGTLAWAYLPPSNDYNGQSLMRFDIAETWIVDPSKRGILLLNVACHEFGHLLGLGHSRSNGALMAPFYNPSVTKPQANDDIPRIQAYYGKPVVVPPIENKPPVAEFMSSISELTAVFTDISRDEDGRIVAWNWSFGDGVNSLQQNPVYTYSEAGTYGVELIVTDDKGAKGRYKANITVSKDPTTPLPPGDDSIEVKISISSGVKGVKIPGYTISKDE